MSGDEGGRLAGLLIRRERLRRDWSQAGLCRGVCAVSYLSKIEQGKAEASPEVIRQLFARLDIVWDTEEDARTRDWIEAGYAKLLGAQWAAFYAWNAALREREPLLRNGRFAADVLVLGAFAGGRKPVDVGLEPFLDARQLALQRAMQGRFPEAVSLCPHPFFWLLHGRTLYRTGRYSAALEALQKAYHGAAEAGYAHIMMESRTFTGNCYSDMDDFSRMMEHYAVAGRLAEALGAAETQEVIRYNMAATQLTLGHAREAYDYYSGRKQHTAMSLHKLAVSCEALGLREEARAALDAAEDAVNAAEEALGAAEDAADAGADALGAAEEALGAGTDMAPSLAREILRLVRYRLDHEDPLSDARYGEKLLSCFARIRRELPVGYAAFHLPWVLAWHKANRQYKQACALLEEFSSKRK